MQILNIVLEIVAIILYICYLIRFGLTDNANDGIWAIILLVLFVALFKH